MSEYDDYTHGEQTAELYDVWYSDVDTAGTVARLAELAGSGPVLELGIGTGRVAAA